MDILSILSSPKLWRDWMIAQSALAIATVVLGLAAKWFSPWLSQTFPRAYPTMARIGRSAMRLLTDVLGFMREVRGGVPGAPPAPPASPPSAPPGAVLMVLGVLALSVSLSACGASQHPLTWDQHAMAGINGAAHGLALLDDGAASYYQARTDDLAAHGGPDGGSLRGEDYLHATSELDASFMAFADGLSAARDSLELAAFAVTRARQVGDAPSQCRAGLIVEDAFGAFQRALTLAVDLGAHPDPAISAEGSLLEGIASSLLLQCGSSDAGLGHPTIPTTLNLPPAMVR